ncbi:hypothetical protein GCM10015535_64350 [Streptomyces gelaticus]|uniref:Uncharacterized protein n=1 Tax=Streptomyces gelaticus TaxID=285446 RepID=A0ABQ2W8N2_9ACTN|nr:hypothetical protein GCM10015535_64350 [Streptomyces gelaticus]
MFREVPQGDAGPGRYAEELVERVVELERARFSQPGEQGSGERLGRRADLDEAVEAVAVADLGGVVAAEMGTGDMARLQPVMRGSAQAAVPPGMRCRFLASVRWTTCAARLIGASRGQRPASRYLRAGEESRNSASAGAPS